MCINTNKKKEGEEEDVVVVDNINAIYSVSIPVAAVEREYRRPQNVVLSLSLYSRE